MVELEGGRVPRQHSLGFTAQTVDLANSKLRESQEKRELVTSFSYQWQ